MIQLKAQTFSISMAWAQEFSKLVTRMLRSVISRGRREGEMQFGGGCACRDGMGWRVLIKNTEIMHEKSTFILSRRNRRQDHTWTPSWCICMFKKTIPSGWKWVNTGKGLKPGVFAFTRYTKYNQLSYTNENLHFSVGNYLPKKQKVYICQWLTKVK